MRVHRLALVLLVVLAAPPVHAELVKLGQSVKAVPSRDIVIPELLLSLAESTGDEEGPEAPWHLDRSGVSASGTLRLFMFDGFGQSCNHGVLEEQVIKNFAQGTSFQVTEYSVTRGAECEELDFPALKSYLDEAIQIAKTSRVVVYFGYVVYGKLQTFSRQFSALAKIAPIIVGVGNIANDSCTENWLAPYGVLVGSARDGGIESYSGRGTCTDLYLDYGGSLTVIIDGQYFGVSGTSTSSAIVAARALTLWAANPQASSTQVSAAVSLRERILTTSELLVAPRVEVLPLHAIQGSVSVAGTVKGPVPSVSIYRGLPSAGACRGRALATTPVGRDGRFTLTVPARGASICVQPQPLGQAVALPIQ